jgi:glycosyltransferase involved in cell wall biosynthesis
MPNLAEHVANTVGASRPVHCIPMGIEEGSLHDIQPLPEGYAEAYIPKGKFVVAHVGTIGITNALDTFLNCASVMAGESDIHFLIVGDGDLKADYIERYGHLPNLTFGPRVAKKSVQSVLGRCDLLYFSVHDSEVWRYGQSLNKVIDYMLSGKPIVASYTGFPSMINEADCGTFVPSADVDRLRQEILRYASMPLPERQATGARGRDWILQHRSYTTLAAQFLEILLPSPIRSGQKRAE